MVILSHNLRYIDNKTLNTTQLYFKQFFVLSVSCQTCRLILSSYLFICLFNSKLTFLSFCSLSFLFCSTLCCFTISVRLPMYSSVCCNKNARRLSFFWSINFLQFINVNRFSNNVTKNWGGEHHLIDLKIKHVLNYFLRCSPCSLFRDIVKCRKLKDYVIIFLVYCAHT
jgi:hypothetical protein